MISEGQFPADCFNIFTNFIKIVKDALVNFKTEHKRFQYFSKQGSYIKPKEKVIGHRLNNVMNSGLSILKPCYCTEQFKPLRLVFKSFFHSIVFCLKL